MAEGLPLQTVSCHHSWSAPHLTEFPQIPSPVLNMPLPKERCSLSLPRLILIHLFWHLMPSSPTLFQKRKGASHPSESRWPSGTCPTPNGQRWQASLCKAGGSSRPCWKPSLGFHTVHLPSDSCVCPFRPCRPPSRGQLDLVSSFCGTATLLTS